MTPPSGRKRVQRFLQNEKIIFCTPAAGKTAGTFRLFQPRCANLTCVREVFLLPQNREQPDVRRDLLHKERCADKKRKYWRNGTKIFKKY